MPLTKGALLFSSELGIPAELANHAEAAAAEACEKHGIAHTPGDSHFVLALTWMLSRQPYGLGWKPGDR